MKAYDPDGIKIVCQNKKARHNFTIEDTFEVGVVLRGTEVKSLRNGKANLVDSYATISGEEAWLNHFHIDPYTPATQFNHHPMRKRKLLLHKKEIRKLQSQIDQKGLTLIPLVVYFRNGRAKVELGLARRKNLVDKRRTIAQRKAEREAVRAIKQSGRELS